MLNHTIYHIYEFGTSNKKIHQAYLLCRVERGRVALKWSTRVTWVFLYANDTDQCMNLKQNENKRAHIISHQAYALCRVVRVRVALKRSATAHARLCMRTVILDTHRIDVGTTVYNIYIRHTHRAEWYESASRCSGPLHSHRRCVYVNSGQVLSQ